MVHFIQHTPDYVLRGDLSDDASYCYGNEGEITIKVIGNNTLEVRSYWWKKGDITSNYQSFDETWTRVPQ